MQSDIVIAYVRCYPTLLDTDYFVSVMGPTGSGKSNASDILFFTCEISAKIPIVHQ